jgi:hypothetical protein
MKIPIVVKDAIAIKITMMVEANFLKNSKHLILTFCQRCSKLVDLTLVVRPPLPADAGILKRAS